jgi:tetratricopeptide (TPR) repeat protein
MSFCPTDEVLTQLLDGSLPAEDSHLLGLHLRDCPTCPSRLDRLCHDSGLRSWAAEGPHPPPEAGLLRALTALKAAGRLPVAEAESGTNLHATPPPGPWGPGRFPPPPRVGPYEVLEELGRGGMGIVYKGQDATLCRPVAVKVLRPELADERARARFLREARAAARLRHEHVVHVYAVDQTADGLPYLVMEYVAGSTLAAHVRGRRLDPRQAVALLVQVADALTAAHDAGLVHRDVKPGNVLLEPAADGRVTAKLTDFGLARDAGIGGTLTGEGDLAGTPAYMSPEQVRGAARLDARTDVYGLGATLYEALTGEVPFRGTPAAVLHQVLEEEPRPPRRLNEAIPRDLETVCLKALAKEPGRRYPTAAAFADDLRRFLMGEPVRARPVGRLGRLWRWCRRNPGMTSLAAALVVALAGGAAGGVWQWSRAVAERDEARRQHARAQDNFRLAREAVDAYLTRVSEHPDLKSHDFEPLRRELLQTARDFYEHFVAEEPDDPALLAELGRAHGRLGLIVTLLESRPRGLVYYQHMQAIFERLHRQDPDNAGYQDDLAESFLQQGISYRAMGRLQAAEDAYGHSRALREDLVRAHPDDPTFPYQLARTLKEVGVFSNFSLNHYDRAEQVLREARTLYERLPSRQAREVSCRFGFALVLLNLGKVYGFTGRAALQAENCRAAADLLEPLARDHPENPEHALWFADTLSELGDAYLRLGQADRAEASWRRALGAAEELARRHPATAYYRHLVADNYYNLGTFLYHERHNPQEARLALGKALDIEEELVLRYPEVGEYVFYLGNLLRDFRNLFDDTRRLETALERFTSALREHEAGHPSPAAEQVPAAALLHLGRAHVLGLLGRHTEALAESRKAQALVSEEQRGGIDEYWEASALVQQGELAPAAALAARLAGKAGDDGTRHYRAAVVYARLAGASAQGSPAAGGQGPPAEEYGARAVELLRRARARQYFSAPSTRYLLRVERDLGPLRGRADFQKVLAEVEGETKAPVARD